MKKIIYSPGEPAGIGPDLIIQLAASKAWENFKIPIITIGDPVLFIERAKKLKKKVKVLELDSLNNIQKNTRSLIQVLKVSKYASAFNFPMNMETAISIVSMPESFFKSVAKAPVKE